jgi:hypothetical protein
VVTLERAFLLVRAVLKEARVMLTFSGGMHACIRAGLLRPFPCTGAVPGLSGCYNRESGHCIFADNPARIFDVHLDPAALTRPGLQLAADPERTLLSN